MPSALLLSCVRKVSAGVLKAGWRRVRAWAWAWDTHIKGALIRPSARVPWLLAFATAGSHGCCDHSQVGSGSLAGQGLSTKLATAWWG
jgi:hypothetical protein